MNMKIQLRGTGDNCLERWSVYAEEFLRTVGIAAVNHETFQHNPVTGERLFDAAIHRDYIETVLCHFDDEIGTTLNDRITDFNFFGLQLTGPTSHNIASLFIHNATADVAPIPWLSKNIFETNVLAKLINPREERGIRWPVWSDLSEEDQRYFCEVERRFSVMHVETSRLANQVRQERLKLFAAKQDKPGGKNRGRKVKHECSPEDEKSIIGAWKGGNGSFKTKEEVANRLSLELDLVNAVIDRNSPRKKRKPSSKG
jgi:hypothetical protein